MEKNTIEDLLATENKQLQKLNEIVLKAVEEEKLLSHKILEFEEPPHSFGGKFADRVASFGGSWKFIILFTLMMGAWMLTNVYLLSRPFDPYPFILLNLILSTVAALQAPIIMMSQNRREERDRRRAINDYLVNLKAEVEIRNMHEKLDLLIAEQMDTLFEVQKKQLDILNGINANLGKVEKT